MPSKKSRVAPRRAKGPRAGATLELSLQDLELILRPLVIGDVVSDIAVTREPDRGIGVRLTDLNISRFVPNFDVPLVITAHLADARTVLCELDMDGALGVALAIIKPFGGLSWLVGQFPCSEAFSVTSENEILVHLDNLPTELAEWLTERLTITDIETPVNGPIAARIQFTVNRYAEAQSIAAH
jgi:hypothetical protein